MDSPRPGALTIRSRYARRISAVCGMPSAAKRLSQVGLLSSIASSPLSSASIAAAVAFSVGVCMSAPGPVANLGQVLAVGPDVARVLDQPCLQLAPDRKPPLACRRQAVDRVHGEVEAVEV